VIQISASNRSIFNPVEYGKKLLKLYEDDKLLGVVTVPWGITFGIWFFTGDDAVTNVILYLSLAVGLVAIASAIKHLVVTVLAGKYGIEAKNNEVIEIQTDTQANKEIAESHYQMEIVNMFARSTNGVATILLNRSIEFLKEGNNDHTILELYAKTIEDLNDNLSNHLDRVSMPFKDFVSDLFVDQEENAEIPTSKNIPSLSEHAIDPQMIKDLSDKIESHNPTADDMVAISEDVTKMPENS